MAGRGERFRKEGFSLPKPLIEFNNKTMIEYAIESLGIEGNYIFITYMSMDYKIHSRRKYTPDNTILFTIARMNPPTPGHLSVIQTLIDEGIRIGLPEVYVILSRKNDDNENPISCNEKEEVLSSEDRTNNMIYSIKEEMKKNTDDEEIRNKIDNIVVKTICVGPKQNTPFSPLYGIVNSKGSTGLHLLLVIGEDRNDLVKSIENAMDKNENVASVEGILLTRKNMSEYKDKECGDLLQLIREKGLPERTSISASFVRDLVKCGLYDEFSQLYSHYLNQEKIEKLYQQIHKGLIELPNPKKSKSAKSKSAIPKSKSAIPKSKNVELMSDVQSNPLESVFAKMQSESPSQTKRKRKRKGIKSEESEFNEKSQSELKEDESLIKRRQSRKISQSEERGQKEKMQSELKEDESLIKRRQSRKISKSEERGQNEKMQSESSGKRKKKGGKKTKKRVY